MSAATEPPPRGWRVVRAAGAVVLVWIALDLVFGVALPGAATLEQLAFAAVVELPVYVIFGGPLVWTGGAAAIVAAITLRSRFPGPAEFLGEAFQAAAWAVVGTAGIVGVLKLPVLTLPLVAVAAGSAFVHARAAPDRPTGRARTAAAVALVAVVGGAAVVQLHALVWSDELWRSIVAAIDDGAAPARVALVGSVVAAAGLVATLLPIPLERLTTDRAIPRWLPRFALGLFLAGALGHERALAGPYFSLWGIDVPEALHRLDRDPRRVHPEAFRLAATDDGSTLLVVYRQSTRLALYSSRGGGGRGIPLALPDEGTLENVVWDGARDRFLVSFEHDDPTAPDALLVVPRAGTPIGRLEVPDHGWIASLTIDGDDLLIGYEARPTLLRWDLATDRPREPLRLPRLGDVEDAVAVGGRLYTVPLHHPWGLHLSEVDVDAGAITRQLRIGGANQQLVAAGDRLLTGRYYASRVTVIDRVAWRVERSLRAGFGVRAIGVDVGRGLVVTGGQYAGELRVHDLADGRELARVPSCGYVKDLVVVRGAAFFASLCGVWRLDLDALEQAP